MNSTIDQLTNDAKTHVATLKTRGFSDVEARQITATAFAETLRGRLPSNLVIEFVYAIYPEGRRS